MPYKTNFYKKQLYIPNASTPFKLSRSKLELFIDCPRCFYLDRRLGIARPSGPPFTLNSAVDKLLKNEFDSYRAKGEKHPIMIEYNIDAIPAQHHLLEDWRYNFTGIQYFHQPTNLIIFGAIDDLWINKNQEYIIVDYKSTSKEGKITMLDQDWHITYKRQMEIYQWLFKQNNFKTSATGYFLYCNGLTESLGFNKKLEFATTLITYTGNTDWIENTIIEAKKCLDSNSIPEFNDTCEFCQYAKNISVL